MVGLVPCSRHRGGASRLCRVGWGWHGLRLRHLHEAEYLLDNDWRLGRGGGGVYWVGCRLGRLFLCRLSRLFWCSLALRLCGAKN